MKKKWWHDKIAYQIYPKSFLDTNGDGIGDLRGVITKLDYLKELGIDIIWLSPIYQSPFVDQGYDISDYYNIGEEFGTMEDFDELLAETKKRDMYVVMDLVVNHCSDKHEWFQKALKDPYGKYAGYFHFVKGKDGRVPNNWRSYFGGSVWEPVPGTDMYYLHFFAKEQPDLNWENQELRQEIYKMINWWLEKGIAGFRIDAIINIKKDLRFPSFEPDGPDGLASCIKMVEEVGGVGDYFEDIKRNTFAKYDAFTVAEVFNMKEDELTEFIGDDGHFSTMFDFSAHTLMQGEKGWYENKTFDFKEWRDTIFASQLQLQKVGFAANIIENHDEPRGASRFLPEHARNEAGKKMLATTSLLLYGIPFIYQGQEIGMTNCRREDISEYDDISTKDQYREALVAGCTKERAMEVCFENSRDNARTPMQWSSGRNAGFTEGEPWLALNSNYREINVEEQAGRSDSLLSYYKALTALKKHPEYKETLTYGRFVPDYEENGDVFAFHRISEAGQDVLVAANYGKEPQTLMLAGGCEKVLLSNMGKETVKKEETDCSGCLTLDSCEAAVLLLR